MRIEPQIIQPPRVASTPPAIVRELKPPPERGHDERLKAVHFDGAGAEVHAPAPRGGEVRP